MDKKIIKKVILVGAGGSGKDYAKTLLTNFGFVSDVSHTTRLPRSGEVAGKDYHFISENEFLKKVFRKEFIQWNYLGNGHCYGTLIKDWECCNLFIMTPNILDIISEFYEEHDLEKDYIVFHFNVSEAVRRERLLSRPNSSERHVDDRIAFDSVMFDEYTSYDELVTNPLFKDMELLDKIFSNPKYDSSDLLQSIKGNK